MAQRSRIPVVRTRTLGESVASQFADRSTVALKGRPLIARIGARVDEKITRRRDALSIAGNSLQARLSRAEGHCTTQQTVHERNLKQ